jgi:hypothetical protein
MLGEGATPRMYNFFLSLFVTKTTVKTKLYYLALEQNVRGTVQGQPVEVHHVSKKRLRRPRIKHLLDLVSQGCEYIGHPHVTCQLVHIHQWSELLYEDDVMLTSLNSFQKDTNMAAMRISDMETVKPKLSLCSIS